MRRIPAAKFKEQCLALLDEVDRDGFVITKHGKPVARLVAINAEPSALIGSLKHKIKIHGAILSSGVKWDAES